MGEVNFEQQKIGQLNYAVDASTTNGLSFNVASKIANFHFVCESKWVSEMEQNSGLVIMK